MLFIYVRYIIRYMPEVPYGGGNWFHSRSSSSRSERDAIIKLVQASKKSCYSSLRWSGDRTNPLAIQFGNEISVEASTMQTKIRAFIRFGFIKDGHSCPLELTSLGKIWWNLYAEDGDKLKKHADLVEALLLVSYLSTYSFNSDRYVKNPTNNYRPIYELQNSVDSTGFISESDLETLIAGNSTTSNFDYWKKDLLRSKILKEVTGGFKFTNTFPNLINAVRMVTLPTTLTDQDWNEIHDNVLDDRNPYKDPIQNYLDDILSGTLDIESMLSEEEKEVISTIISTIDKEEASEIGLGDYRIPDTYSKTKIRKKQSAWSKEVKKAYNYTCCVPECDIQSPILTVACHIKKYGASETGNGHRANPSNGLCLCPNCHTLFDNGYFTLTDDLKIKVSPKIEEINSPRIRNIHNQSDNKVIDPLPSPKSFRPSVEFMKYHREKVYLS